MVTEQHRQWQARCLYRAREFRMKLYGGLASPYVARVVLFARLKGLTLVPEMPPGGIKAPEYLAKNPMGKMPVLEVDGAAIPESEVICEYLEDLHPGTGGLPGTPADRARARLISRIHDVYLSSASGTLFRNLNPARRDEAAVASATASTTAGIGYLEHFVVASPFAAGSEPSLADCTLLPSFVIMRKTLVPAFGLADPTAGTGTLGRWFSSCAADPVTGPFIQEYSAAVDAFLRMLAAK
jgi:glutathione S-transferase